MVLFCNPCFVCDLLHSEAGRAAKITFVVEIL